MTEKWAMLIDVDKCSNCRNCFLACKDEYVDNRFPGYSEPQPLHGHNWIDILVKERGDTPHVDVVNVPVMCMQCDDAPCMKVGGDGAVYKRDDGIVMIDPVKAAGRKDIVESCPYGAIHWNEDLSLPQKWSFDAHLLDQGWKQPRATQACPTGALNAVKISQTELEARVSSGGYKPMKPDLGTAPRVFYKNLDRFTKSFVAITVLKENNGVVDAFAGAAVTLQLASGEVFTSSTDEFGDCRIDGIAPDSDYSLTVDAGENGSWSGSGTLGESRWLGEILL